MIEQLKNGLLGLLLGVLVTLWVKDTPRTVKLDPQEKAKLELVSARLDTTNATVNFWRNQELAFFQHMDTTFIKFDD